MSDVAIPRYKGVPGPDVIRMSVSMRTRKTPPPKAESVIR